MYVVLCLLEHKLRYTPERVAPLIITCAILHNVLIKNNVSVVDDDIIVDEIEDDDDKNHQQIEGIGGVATQLRQMREDAVAIRIRVAENLMLCINPRDRVYE